MFRVAVFPASLALAAAAYGCAVAKPGQPDGGPLLGQPDADVPADAAPASPDAQPVVDPACAASLAGYRYDWESGDQAWSHKLMPVVDPPPVTWTFDHWERGTATSGPGSCASGSGCWASNLDGNYISCQRAYLQSPAIDLSDCANTSLSLTFEHSYDFWTGSWNGQTWFDGGLVEMSNDGVSWQPIDTSFPGTVLINPNMGIYQCVESDQFYVHGRAGYVGQSGGWQTVEVPIPPEYRSASFQVRFVYASGVSGQTSNQTETMNFTRPGWYIDDLRIEAD